MHPWQRAVVANLVALVVVLSGLLVVSVVTTSPPSVHWVTFEEKGLPRNWSGGWWAMRFGYQQGSYIGPIAWTNNTSVTFDIDRAGVYPYYVWPCGPWDVSYPDDSGQVVVRGTSVVVNVTIEPAPVRSCELGHRYEVGFSETGLSAGANWGLVFNHFDVVQSSGKMYTYYVYNGTYSFSVIPPNATTSASPSQGSIVVYGNYPWQTVTFSSQADPGLRSGLAQCEK